MNVKLMVLAKGKTAESAHNTETSASENSGSKNILFANLKTVIKPL